MPRLINNCVLGTTKYFSVLLLCLIGCVRTTSDLVSSPTLPETNNTVTSVDSFFDPLSEWFNRVTQGNDPYKSVCSLYDSDDNLIGSGTLIRPNVVLTAGHCIDDDSIVSVDFGDEKIAVRKMVLHPHYSDALGRVTNDIGLIFLECDSKYQPAKMGCTEWMERHQPITTVGFSFGYKKYSKFGVFRYFGTVVEQPNVLKFIPRPVPVWFGDSGGGVFTKFGSDEYLVGVISTFTMLKNYKGHGEVTECSAVIVAKHLDWIEMEILNEEMEQSY